MAKKKTSPKTEEKTIAKVEVKVIPEIEKDTQATQSKNQSSQSGA